MFLLLIKVCPRGGFNTVLHNSNTNGTSGLASIVFLANSDTFLVLGVASDSLLKLDIWVPLGCWISRCCSGGSGAAAVPQVLCDTDEGCSLLLGVCVGSRLPTWQGDGGGVSMALVGAEGLLSERCVSGGPEHTRVPPAGQSKHVFHPAGQSTCMFHPQARAHVCSIRDIRKSLAVLNRGNEEKCIYVVFPEVGLDFF